MSGWAISARHPADLTECVGVERVWVERVRVERATPERLRSTLIAGGGGATRTVVETAPAGTAFGNWAKVPALYSTSGDGDIVAACASLTSDRPDLVPGPPTLEVSDSSVAIVWSPDRNQTIDFVEIFAHIPLHET